MLTPLTVVFFVWVFGIKYDSKCGHRKHPRFSCVGRLKRQDVDMLISQRLVVKKDCILNNEQLSHCSVGFMVSHAASVLSKSQQLGDNSFCLISAWICCQVELEPMSA